MKHKVIGSIAVLAIAALTAFNVNINTQENGLSDISLDNVEALATEQLSSTPWTEYAKSSLQATSYCCDGYLVYTCFGTGWVYYPR